MDLGPINELSLCEEDAAAAGGAVCDGRRYSRSRSDCSTTSSTSCPPNEAKYPKGLHRRLSLPVAATESDDCNYTNQARDSAKDCTTSPSDKGKTEPYESWKQYPGTYLPTYIPGYPNKPLALVLTQTTISLVLKTIVCSLPVVVLDSVRPG